MSWLWRHLFFHIRDSHVYLSMPIVIKEVVVRTTVEKSSRQQSDVSAEAIENLKHSVLDELRTEIFVKGWKNERSQGKKRR